MIDLSQACTDGPHFRLDPLGQCFPGGLEPFEYELPCKISVHVVLEDDHHLGQRGLGQGTYLSDVRKTLHGEFQGEGDLLFHIHRCKPRCLGEDHDLHVRHVGKGVYGEDLPGVHAGNNQNERADDDDQTMGQDESKKSIKHDLISTEFG